MSVHLIPPPAFFFSFNDTSTTEIYTLSLHDALPIYPGRLRIRDYVADHRATPALDQGPSCPGFLVRGQESQGRMRSEEHTSELQSPYDLVCRLLLEKKKKQSMQALIDPAKQSSTHCM